MEGDAAEMPASTEQPQTDTQPNQAKGGGKQPEVFEDTIGAPALSLADTIMYGQDVRNRCKKKLHIPLPVRMPKLATPGSKQPPDIRKLRKKPTKTQKANALLDLKRHMRCMQRNKTIMSERMQQISQPTKRQLMNIYKEYGARLPPDMLDRFKAMLDEGRAFNTMEAYDYFENAKRKGQVHRCKKRGRSGTSRSPSGQRTKGSKGKTKGQSTKDKRLRKKEAALSKKEGTLSKKMKAMPFNRRACVLLAHNIQKKLAVPEAYHLTGGMLRLSNVIMEELCCFMGIKMPSRCSNNPMDANVVDICDKIAVWVDQVLVAGESRLLDMEDAANYDEIFMEAAADFADDDVILKARSGSLHSAGSPRAQGSGEKVKSKDNVKGGALQEIPAQQEKRAEPEANAEPVPEAKAEPAPEAKAEPAAEEKK